MDHFSFPVNTFPEFAINKESNSSLDLISFFALDDDTQYSIQSMTESLESSQGSSTLIIPQQESQFEIVPQTNLEISTVKSKKKQKKFLCNIEGCTKTYRSKENLTFHIQNVHENLKPFQCSFCSMKFSHRNGKIYHERKQHTSVLPYQCSYASCGQKFPCKSAMVAHVNSIHLLIKRKRTVKVSFVSQTEETEN